MTLLDIYLRTSIALQPAPDGAPADGQWFIMLIFYGGLFGIFYFLLIRPQSVKAKETEKMQDSLGKGDRIITVGGVFATIHKIEEDVVTLEIAEGVRIKAQRSAIHERIRTADSGEGKADSDAKKKE
jgi:preprotein translocase subunit YajC